MPLEDGAYDIINRKYSVPLGPNELESPSQLVSMHLLIVYMASLSAGRT